MPRHRRRAAVVALGVAAALGLSVATTRTSPMAGASPHGAPPPRAFQCGSVPTPSAAGTALQASVRLDGVTATLRATAAVTPGLSALGRPDLVLTDDAGDRHGSPWRTTVAPAPGAGAVELTDLVGQQPGADQLCLARFGASATTVVLLGLFSGGAHCCTTVRAWAPATGRWASSELEVGNAGIDLRTVAGAPLLVSADNAFAARFTDFADSGMPVVVWQVAERAQGGHDVVTFADHTAAHRDLVAADAEAWWQRAQVDATNPLGLLAAWAADECLLGDQARAFSTLQSLAARHRLTAPPAPAASTWPQGTTYVSALHTFLVQRGYCSGGVAI